MKASYFVLLLLSFALLIPDSPVQAHGVRVFAWRAGDNIKVEVAFRGGRPVRQAEIIVKEAGSDHELLRGTTADNGFLQFALPEEAVTGKMNLKIIADCGAGHRGEWLLKAEDYLEVPAGFSSLSPEKGNKQAAEEDNEDIDLQADEEMIRRIVADELDKKMAPLKRMLHENLEHGTGYRDIIGAIGWLLGLAGIAAWFRSKYEKRD